MALGMLAATGSASPSGLEAVPRVSHAVWSGTLPNGLLLAVVEDHRLPVVQVAIWYRCGSLCDRPGKTGLAHGLEHMVYRGTAALSEAGAGDLTARAGVDFNAETQFDYTHFYALVPATGLQTALRIQADRMHNLTLRDADWENERGVVLSEYDADYGDPQLALQYAARRAAFSGSPYARTPLGARNDIVRSTTRDVRRDYLDWYAPNAAFVIITGDVTPATGLALTLSAFGNLRASKTIPVPPQPPRAMAQRDIQVVSSGPPAVDLAYRVPGYGSQAYATTRVLQRMFANHKSILNAALSGSGLADDFNVDADIQREIGLFHIVVVPSVGHSAAQVEHSVIRALVRAGTSPVDRIDVAIAVHGLLLDDLYAGDSLEALGNAYGFALAAENRNPSIDRKALTQTTAGDVAAMLRHYFSAPTVIAERDAALIGEKAANRPNRRLPPDRAHAERAPTSIVEADWIRKAGRRAVDIPSIVRPVRYVLPNGLRLYVLVQRANPTVFVSGTIDRSSVREAAGQAGIGAVLNDMLAFGGSHSTTTDLAETEERKDLSLAPGESFDLGTVSADTGSADLRTNFSGHSLAADLDTILSLVADALRHPRLSGDYLATAVNQERLRLMITSTASDEAEREVTLMLYPQGSRTVSYPTAQTLKHMSLGDVRAYATRMLRPDLGTIEVIGNVDTEQTLNLVRQHFGDWKAFGPRPTGAVRPSTTKPRQTIVAIAVRRSPTRVVLGMRAPGRQSRDFYAMMLLNELLGANGGFDTRLMRIIRIEHGLAYNVESKYFPESAIGQITIEFEGTPANVRRIRALVRGVLASFRTQPPSTSEVAYARTKLVAGALVAQQSTAALASMVSVGAAYGLPLDYWTHLSEHYALVKPRDIQRVAQRWLAPQDIVEVDEGPTSR